MQHVKIAINPLGFGQIEIDGVPLKNVRGVEIQTEANRLTKVTVTHILSHIEMEGEAEVRHIDVCPSCQAKVERKVTIDESHAA